METTSWKLSGTTATYGTDAETLITVEGVTSIDGLSEPAGTKVKVSAASLSQNSIVTISDGYTLELGDDVTQATLSTPSKEDWDFQGERAFGTISTASAGYQVKENQIKYFTEGETYSYVIINGIEEADGLSINGNVITVSKASLSGVSRMTVSDGFKLALGSDVRKPYTTNPTWTYDSALNKANYTSAGRTDGYDVVNNVIVHFSEKGEESVTITGIKTTVTDNGATVAGIEIKEDTFIISKSCLLKNTDVKLNGDEGCKLALADDVPAPIETSEDWYLDGTTATYKTDSNTEGYTLNESGDKIEYVPENTAETLVTVYGVKSTDGLYLDIDNNVVAVYESALNGTDMTISDGYTFEFAEDIPVPKTQAGWKLADKNITYEEGGISDGYRIVNDIVANKNVHKIAYEAEVPGTVQVALNGVEKMLDFTNKDQDVVKLTAENFSDEGISLESNDANYSFEVTDGNYAQTKFVGKETNETVTNYGNDIAFELGDGKDSIVTNGANVTIDAGIGNDIIDNKGGKGSSVSGGKGNDNVTLSSSDTAENIFVYSTGDGKDNVTGFGKKDKLKIADNAEVGAEVKNDDVVFKVGNGTITLKDAAKDDGSDYLEIVIIGSDDKEISSISGNTYTHDGIIRNIETGERKIDVATTFEGEYVASESIKRTGKVTIVDASKVQKGVSLNGGEEGALLIGGDGKDTLISGKTDGFELTGGKGNDIFVYKGGKGSIRDYSQKGTYGKDKIVTDGLEFTGYKVEGQEVILEYGKDNELTIEEGVGKEITFGVKNSTIKTFQTVGILDEKGKSITLASGESDFAAIKEYSKVETIDGSWTFNNVITGNKKANYIIAGDGGSTLNGGKGKDTLVGGNSNDVFVYDNKSGNKLIQNYGDGDIISLGSGASISEVKATKTNDLELKVGNNKITIADGAGKEFTFIEGDEEKTYNNGLLVNKNGNSASLTSSFDGNEFNMADYENYNSVNAGLLKKGFKLTGDGDTDSLIGGKGNDTLTAGSSGSNLWGGKGNDILIGSEAAQDTFIFRAGEGTDTIYGFNSGGALDELMIYDKRGKESTYNKAVFSGDTDNGTLILSIKGGGKVLLEGISASESIKINGTAHTISGKKLN